MMGLTHMADPSHAGTLPPPYCAAMPDAAAPHSQLRFDGRVALVTGAGGGIGRAHATALAARGARVVVNDLGGPRDGVGPSSPVLADAVVTDIANAGGEAIANAADVADPSGAEDMVRQAIDTWGRLDIVVNNAGITGKGNFADPDVYERVLATHLLGTVNVLRAAWPQLVEQGYGRVVNTASSSVFGSSRAGDYAAAKGGIFAFSRVLAADCRNSNIKVNVVMPVAHTRMTAALAHPPTVEWFERWFPPEKVAAFVVLLCHESVPCSGETFIVGGGRAARVVFATTRGYFDLDATAEAYRDHFDEVMAGVDTRDPGSGFADLARYAELLPDPGPFTDVRWR